MDLPTWFSIATFVGLTVLLLADLAIVARRPHEPSIEGVGPLGQLLRRRWRSSSASSCWRWPAASTPGEFFAGWLTEYSLSIDNLFVFVIIMARFPVPRKLQQEVLMVGIIIALVLRGIFILLGAAVIERFTWVFYIFGAFLVYTAIQLVRHRERGRGLRGERVHPPDAPRPADHAGLRRQQAAGRAGRQEGSGRR